MTPRLSPATLPGLPASVRPPVDPRDLPVRMVHLGLGAFARGHVAPLTEAASAAGDGWGICGLAQRSRDVVDRLAPQDGLYALLVRGADSVAVRVVGTVRALGCAADDPAGLVGRLADPAVAVVTLTVTEKGYRTAPGRRELDVADPEVRADLADGGTRTVVGQLVAGLAARRRADAGPLAVLSCDNLPGNGELVRSVVTEFAGRRDPGLLDWLAEQVTFPGSMVDRIVPAPGAADRDEASALLGVRDEGTVATESFAQWVLADDFRGPRPPWERAGVVLAPSVAPYEMMKLRLLNATHSMLAYLGLLAGIGTIAGTQRHPDLRAAAAALLAEATPTLAPVPGVDVDAYAAQVLVRFANPAIAHRCAQVAADGSHKIPQRLLGTVRDRLAAGAVPRLPGLAIAAWLHHLGGVDDRGIRFPVVDPLADRLAAEAGRADPAAAVAGVLTPGLVGPDLAASTVLAAEVTRWLRLLRSGGALAAARAAVTG